MLAKITYGTLNATLLYSKNRVINISVFWYLTEYY